MKQYSQHQSQLSVEVNIDEKILNIHQKISFHNQSNDTLSTIVLNDWNNAYSNVNSPLAKRFSDEFYRGFHLAKEEERGSTQNITIIDENKLFLSWHRSTNTPDVISVKLREKLAPNEKTTLLLTYIVKVPSDRFTKFGYTDLDGMNLKNWFLTPARYKNHKFITYNNENLDDIVNAISDFDIELKIPINYALTTDLNSSISTQTNTFSIYQLSGKNRMDFSLILEPTSTFENFPYEEVNVITNLKDTKLSSVQKAIIIDCIVKYTTDLIGKYPFEKIVISETDYERNPFYGLNQLPSFISPFSDTFVYEIKFLKTYLNAFLKNSLALDQRKQAWIHDAIQVYAMMKYININHPNSKMMGSASTFKLLKSFNLTNLDFNEQYSYFYMLMARKNLDQPLSMPKNELIKFNEQIASKYRAGLSLRFLDNYLENQVVTNSIRELYSSKQGLEVENNDFETILKKNSTKDIDWFFKTIINSRKAIDYKFASVSKTNDSISFSLKNKTGVIVPVPVYGVKNGEIVLKKWLEPKNNDSLYTIERNNADKIVLNYKNEVPEYNLRNNWKSLKGFFPNNRPVKFVFMKDLEDPYYNQVLYVPTLDYNLYDGFIPGIRFHNKTILDKPFTFDLTPAYSIGANTFSGSGSLVVNQNYRESNLFNVRYAISGSYFHFAPDATYLKLNPNVQIRFRENDFRDNRKELIYIRQVIVNREESKIIPSDFLENYSVFNARYYNTKTEVTNHFSFMSEIQISNKFSKAITEISYRKLFENNHQINLRLFAGSFIHNQTNTDFFSFALDKPTDYLFDYNYYGRSEETGFFSQQLIIADGGFKSKLKTPYANQWMTTLNGGYNIWNWIELYGDVGYLKNKYHNDRFLFDSGIRLNLVTDYFEVYLPVYSSNGWEIGQNKYNEKIRFVITLSPKIVMNLFNRKWF
ncbi:aminopeptidase [Flavobacterium sp. NG2]|uniref:aminopeptidase n=1 Tax=Flavobacterium sp. NG2 TaxID=3097547 RepID=UPI002A8047BB|nr:aminopeptidase [Flavobacterium sp. NG2]WPR70635.1 aminopeptidase [Flavobacterium sp. NG2]